MQTREAAEGGRKPDTVERQWTSLFSALAGTLPTLPALWLSLKLPGAVGGSLNCLGPFSLGVRTCIVQEEKGAPGCSVPV